MEPLPRPLGLYAHQRHIGEPTKHRVKFSSSSYVPWIKRLGNLIVSILAMHSAWMNKDKHFRVLIPNGNGTRPRYDILSEFRNQDPEAILERCNIYARVIMYDMLPDIQCLRKKEY